MTVENEHPNLSRGRASRDRILAFITSHVAEKGYAPSVRDICDAVGLASTSTVQRHLLILVAEGRIVRPEGLNRAITIVELPE